MKKSINPRATALLSVDNTRSFGDRTLDELYVPQGEHVAQKTKELIDVLKPLGVPIINICEKHTPGHASFASSYTHKQPFDWLYYDEIKDWTEDSNQLSPQARFDLDKLKAHLQKEEKMQLRYDHSIVGTPGAEITSPLHSHDFDYTIVKGNLPHTHPMGPFEETAIDDLLQTLGVENVIITGLATEFCVRKTALDASNTYTTYLIKDAISGITESGIEKTFEEMKKHNVDIITSQELLALFSHHSF